MEPTITKSNENIEILWKLISSGYYVGEIEESKFELKRVALANNIRVFGTEDGNGKYRLKTGFWFPMNIAYYLLLISSAIVLLVAFLTQKWIAVLLIIIIIPIILFTNYHSQKKELRLFTDKFLSFKST